MKEFLKEIFTDAKGRIEVKIVLGVPIIIIAVVYGIFSAVVLKAPDWTGFGALSGLGIGLIGGTAVTDAIIDNQRTVDEK